MAEEEREREEEIDESGENLTQRRMGESEEPVDVGWQGQEWGETEATPHEGEEGTEPV